MGDGMGVASAGGSGAVTAWTGLGGGQKGGSGAAMLRPGFGSGGSMGGVAGSGCDGSMVANGGYPAGAGGDGSMVANGRYPTGSGVRGSAPVEMADLLAAFEDGKEAASYAYTRRSEATGPGEAEIIHAYQQRGHMFITLIKYNKDKSTVCRSFGFYPRKSTLFSATPFHPHSPSVFKDDAGHDWDEAAGKFIFGERRLGRSSRSCGLTRVASMISTIITAPTSV